MADDYAGDLSPREAWALLEKDLSAQLVDVRSDAEWRYVGFPLLETLGKKVHCVSWQIFPEMDLNPAFADQVTAAGLSKEQPLLFLCRSGVRSKHAAIALTALGFQRCYNVAEGFEGDRDAAGHRGNSGGWKHAGLPWTQN